MNWLKRLTGDVALPVSCDEGEEGRRDGVGDHGLVLVLLPVLFVVTPVVFEVTWLRMGVVMGVVMVCRFETVAGVKVSLGLGLRSGAWSGVGASVAADGWPLKRSWASARAFSSQRLRTLSIEFATRCDGVHLRVPLGVALPVGWGNRPRPEIEPARDSDVVRSSSRVWYANAPGAPDCGGDCEVAWPLPFWSLAMGYRDARGFKLQALARPLLAEIGRAHV